MSAVLRRRHDAGAGHARRRVALPRRPHQLSAHRQHGLPAVARPARQPARARAAGSRWPPRRRGSPGRTSSRPRRGKKRTTDHPPIYPVGAPKKELSGDQAKVYDLVARRFLATLLPAAVIERPARRPPPRHRSRSWRYGSPRGVARLPRGLREVRGQARPAAAAAAAGRHAQGARPALRGQGDAAARPLRPGQAHREDGGARPGHQGHARRHHPAPLRPQLRARQPRGAHGARRGAHRRLRRGHGAGAGRHLLQRR